VLLSAKQAHRSLVSLANTYEDFLSIQVYSDPAPMHCSSAQGKKQTHLLSAALQNRLTSSLVSLSKHLSRFSLSIGVQWPIINALQLCSGQKSLPTVLLTAKSTPHCSLLLNKIRCQKPCVTAKTPMKIFSPYKCAVTQLWCTCFGKKNSPLLTAALQNRLTSSLASQPKHLVEEGVLCQYHLIGTDAAKRHELHHECSGSQAASAHKLPCLSDVWPCRPIHLGKQFLCTRVLEPDVLGTEQHFITHLVGDFTPLLVGMLSKTANYNWQFMRTKSELQKVLHAPTRNR